MPYVYAVTDAAAAPPPTLYPIAEGALAAVVADHDAPAPTAEALLRHEAVVERLMEDGPLLPMRFGSVTPDVNGWLAAEQARLSAALERVRGAVELGVRAADPGPPAASGTEYLMRRAASTALGDRVHAALAGLARASVRVPKPPHVGAYLVDRDAVEGFRARAGEHEGVVCTGPWPPYSFAAP